MDYDLILVIGLVICGFSIASIVSAFAESRAPRIAAIVVLIGGGMVAYVVNQRPGHYTIEGIPELFVEVVGRYIM